MGERPFEYVSPNHMANLNDMRENNILCNVTIKVHNIEYRAHKIVLAANLKYFKTRLLNPPKDSDPHIIDMTEVNVTNLAEFISYAYIGKIFVTMDNVLSLLKDAYQLEDDGIKEACITFLRGNLKVEEACSAYVFAGTIDNAPLINAATAIIIENLLVCSKTTEFVDVDYEDLKKCLYDTKSDSESQRELFEEIVRWIMHNVESRMAHIDELLGLIDITKLTEEYMLQYTNVLDDKLYYNHELSNMVFSFDLTSQKINQIATLNETSGTNVMCASTHFLYIYGSNTDNHRIENPIRENDPQTGVVNAFVSTKFRKTQGSAAIFYEDCIHVLGGESASDKRLFLKSAFKYHTVRHKQDTFPSMNVPRACHALAVLDGKLYACEGYDRSVEVYEEEEWREVAPMIKNRYDFLVVAHEGKLFAIGGDAEKTVEVYDPNENQWQIDQEASFGLQIEHPKGGLISDKCLRQRDLKRFLELTNEDN